MKMNRTTQRTVEILKLVSKNPEGVSLDEICGQLELPKTSCYDIITTLAAMGMVNVAPGQKQKYTIGLQAYRIGMNYTNNLNFISVIEPELRAFAREHRADGVFRHAGGSRGGLYHESGAGKSDHYHRYGRE